jgi:hypothetical protein
MVVAKRVSPAVPHSLDEVWYIRDEVDVPLIKAVGITHSVGDAFRVRGFVHSEELPVD